MSIRVLPDYLVNQIAAGEVVENPASVVKELIENALDAGADQIIVDVVDGGRTLISVIDNGKGMSKIDLSQSITRHATSKLPDDDLLNINFMGFRGEALPSIASVSDMFIDTCNKQENNGWCLNASNSEITPSDWENGTRVKVLNLFSKTPARLKFLRTDKGELLSVIDTVKKLAMAKPEVGFVLNNKWFFTKQQSLLDRITSIIGEDISDKMLQIESHSSSGNMFLHGFISRPTFKRASSIDEYLFVNGRPVKDKILISALRAAYMDVMHAREFPVCVLYLDLPARNVDVNVSPAKTEVHFLEPNYVRAFIIKTLREALSKTLNDTHQIFQYNNSIKTNEYEVKSVEQNNPFCTSQINTSLIDDLVEYSQIDNTNNYQMSFDSDLNLPLGRVIGQLNNKYILSENEHGLIIVDQHAAHERITYEKLRKHKLKSQPLLAPIVVKLRPEDVTSVMIVADELQQCGLVVDVFGDTAIAIFEKPADWDLNWGVCLQEIADEVRAYGNSSQLGEKLHLKLANHACHHSVRAGQKLNFDQMNQLLREIEATEHGGECNHGRPVYKLIKISDLDSMFERI